MAWVDVRKASVDSVDHSPLLGGASDLKAEWVLEYKDLYTASVRPQEF